MNARQLAYKVIARVERDRAYSNLALAAELGRMPADAGDDSADGRDANALEADRRLATELVYGVLRNRRWLDHWIDTLASRPQKIDPAVRHVLRLAFYQLLFLDRIPQHAVLNETARLLKQIKRKHAVGFANALLRGYLRGQREGFTPPEPKADDARLALRHSIPDWLMARWREELSAETSDPKRLFARLSERAEHANTPAPLTLFPNLTRIDASGLMAELRARGAEAERGEYAPHAVLVKSGGFAKVADLEAAGLCHVMDEAAQLVGEAMGIAPGERVLDMCAAPGGKTLYAAAQTGEGGEVVAVDLSESKLGLAAEQARAHGFEHVKTLAADAREPLPGLDTESFDVVLVDAPCTALGIVRRHPEIRWRREPGDLLELAEVSRRIVDNARTYVRPGGRLVFSVCTTTHEEGVDQLAHLARPGWRFETHPSVFPALWRETEIGRYFTTAYIPTLDGFFCVCLVRDDA